MRFIATVVAGVFLALPSHAQPTTVPIGANVLAPMAHTMFCLAYKQDCRPAGTRRALESDLSAVNNWVNSKIQPERNTRGLEGEKWLLHPPRGDCNDYAVTKQHELRKRGWGSHNLMLAEVVTRSGEHHLVLVVRTKIGDVVLDSLSYDILPWHQVPYSWVRIQSAENIKFWHKVQGRRAAAR